MQITPASPAFREGQPIPCDHTCQGRDVPPALRWEGVPAETRSPALICEDPDAPLGTWIHWVLCAPPPETRELPEHVPPDPSLPNRPRQGVNSFRTVGYRDPCPPPGKPHRYFFRLFALDAAPRATPRRSSAP